MFGIRIFTEHKFLEKQGEATSTGYDLGMGNGYRLGYTAGQVAANNRWLESEVLTLAEKQALTVLIGDEERNGPLGK